MTTTESFPTWQHRFTATRVTGRKRVTVEAGLHYLEGNTRPHFSVTCSIDEQARNGRWAEAGGGAAHDDILKLFPKLAPVVALHLADDDGTPMHAIANAVYWLGRTDYPDARNMETFARHLRLSETEAADADNFVAESLGKGWYHGDARSALRAWLDTFEVPARWKREADAAVAVLDSLIEKAAAK